MSIPLLKGVKNAAQNILRNPTLRLLFWVAVSLLLLYMALRDVHLGEVWIALRQADLRYVVLGLISVGLNVLAKAARWQVLIGPREKKISFGRILMVMMVGQTLNWFVPGRVGDLSRAFIIGNMGPGKTFVFGTIALEKVLDMISYALLFLLLLLLLPLPGWLTDSGYTFSVITAVVLLGVVILAIWPAFFIRQIERMTGFLPEVVRQQLNGRFQVGLTSLKVLHQKSELIRLAFWSAVIWGTAIWTNALASQALSINLPWTAALAVLVVLQAGISIPAAPGRFGIFQYLCILALAFFGVSQSVGLSYGILLQAIVLIPTTLISLPFFGILGVNTRSSDLRSV